MGMFKKKPDQIHSDHAAKNEDYRLINHDNVKEPSDFNRSQPNSSQKSRYRPVSRVSKIPVAAYRRPFTPKPIRPPSARVSQLISTTYSKRDSRSTTNRKSYSENTRKSTEITNQFKHYPTYNPAAVEPPSQRRQSKFYFDSVYTKKMTPAPNPTASKVASEIPIPPEHIADNYRKGSVYQDGRFSNTPRQDSFSPTVRRNSSTRKSINWGSGPPPISRPSVPNASTPIPGNRRPTTKGEKPIVRPNSYIGKTKAVNSTSKESLVKKNVRRYSGLPTERNRAVQEPGDKSTMHSGSKSDKKVSDGIKKKAEKSYSTSRYIKGNPDSPVKKNVISRANSNKSIASTKKTNKSSQSFKNNKDNDEQSYSDDEDVQEENSKYSNTNRPVSAAARYTGATNLTSDKKKRLSKSREDNSIATNSTDYILGSSSVSKEKLEELRLKKKKEIDKSRLDDIKKRSREIEEKRSHENVTDDQPTESERFASSSKANDSGRYNGTSSSQKQSSRSSSGKSKSKKPEPPSVEQDSDDEDQPKPSKKISSGKSTKSIARPATKSKNTEKEQSVKPKENASKSRTVKKAASSETLSSTATHSSSLNSQSVITPKKKTESRPSSQPNGDSTMHTCKYCGRSFSTENDRHLAHERVCKRSKQKEKTRVARRESKEKEAEKEKKLQASSINSKSTSATAKKKNWRKEHDNLINAIRAAKAANNVTASKQK